MEETKKGSVKGIEQLLIQEVANPSKKKHARYPLRERVSEMVNEMLKGGIISESSSPWARPVVIVRKKDGSLRFCVDYRQLNAVTKKDVFLLPCIDNLLAPHSMLEEDTGQIPVSAESKQKTVFITHEGLFEFDVMTFGLCNAPATFQRLMQKILSGLGSFGNVYIDDILIFSTNFDEHWLHLQEVFGRLERYIQSEATPPKCQMALPEVGYLGHVVSAEGAVRIQ